MNIVVSNTLKEIYQYRHYINNTKFFIFWNIMLNYNLAKSKSNHQALLLSQIYSINNAALF